MDFKLSIQNLEGKKVINFINNTKNFIEVIFTIDGREVKEEKALSDDVRGYAYPPKLEKPVKKKKDGSFLRFNRCGGEVVAYIFEGEGKYKDEDLDKPTFLRHKLVNKISFRRISNEPFKIMKLKY